MSDKKELLKQAIELSKHSYYNQVVPDETTDGATIFVAKTLELSGCIAQGNSPEEALRNLEEARVDYILSLLEDNLPVPEPSTLIFETKSTNGIVHFFGKSADGKNDDIVAGSVRDYIFA